MKLLGRLTLKPLFWGRHFIPAKYAAEISILEQFRVDAYNLICSTVEQMSKIGSEFLDSLISESLHDSPLQKGHGFAASLGGVNSSYHHNLLANNAGRNPSIAGETSNPTINLDFRNNVIFNWQKRRLDGRPESINVVKNYYNL